MYLDTFTFIILFSYIIGALPLTRLLRGKRGRDPLLILLSILQGALVLYVSRLVIGTGIAASLGGLSLFIGQRWSIFQGFKAEGRILFKAGGFWLFLTPVPLLVSFFTALVLYLLFSFLFKKPGIVSSLLLCLLFPFIVWYFTGYDLYLILATLSSFFFIYELVPYLFSPYTIQRLLFSSLPRVRKKKYITKVRVLLITSALLFTIVFLLNRHVYRGFGLQVDLFSRGNPDLSYIALTFDDGPDPDYTPYILDILKEHEIKATFFLVGDHVRLYPHIARRIVEEGHEIGNHTMYHRNLYRLRPDLIIKEMEEAHAMIKEVTGERVHLFRPPRGLYDANVKELALERGYTLVLWSLSSWDWAEISSRLIEQRILTNTRGGDVLLFHDSGSIIARSGGNRYNTIKALPGIITGLKEMGFHFLTITEMIIIDELSRERGEKDDPESQLPGY